MTVRGNSMNEKDCSSRRRRLPVGSEDFMTILRGEGHLLSIHLVILPDLPNLVRYSCCFTAAHGQTATWLNQSRLWARTRIKRWLNPSGAQAASLICRWNLRFVPRRLLWLYARGLCRRWATHPWPDPSSSKWKTSALAKPGRLHHSGHAVGAAPDAGTASHALRGSGYGAAVGAGTPGSGGRARCQVCRAAGAAAAHARATSRETIGVAASPGARGVEANCALMPSTQRRQRSVSW